MQTSLSRAGNDYDNAAIESFWATTKTELLQARVFASHAEARTALVSASGCHRRVGRPFTSAVASFAVWLERAAGCGVEALQTFAAGLCQDGAAVRAALALPWSSGQAEGQINWLKMLKRQIYGRAGFDLLRRRVLLRG